MKNVYARIKLFKEMLATMQELEVSVQRREVDLASCLFLTGDMGLAKNAMTLVALYPVLGFRPIKGAGYVHHRALLPTAMGWQKQSVGDNNDDYKIARTDAGVFICTCPDFSYNLKAIRVPNGPPQQPCCHILAAALSDPDILGVFLPKATEW